MTHIDDRREPRFEGDIGDRIRPPIVSPGMPSGLGAEQPVLDAQSLIDRLGLGNAIGVLRIKLAFPAEVFALVNDADIKVALKANTEEAVARGVFGAPTVFVGDAMFFGQDRLDFVREALG